MIRRRAAEDAEKICRKLTSNRSDLRVSQFISHRMEIILLGALGVSAVKPDFPEHNQIRSSPDANLIQFGDPWLG